MFGLKTWAVCGLMVAGAGCARFHPEPLAPEQTAGRFDARRLDSPDVKAFVATNAMGGQTNWPPAEWDANSLTLAAFYFHPDLEVARAQWRLAEAGVLTAGARPNPSVSFSPSYDTQIPNNPSPWILPVTWDVPIETAGKRSKRIAEAERAAESARFGFISAAWQIRSEVRASLLELTMAKRRAGILEQQMATQSNIVQALQGQFEAGAVSRPELAAVQIAGQKTEQELNAANAKQVEARARLAAATGVSEAALAGLEFEYGPAVAERDPIKLGEARTVALRERADILGALADYAAAEAAVRLEIARQFPDLHLGPDYAWNNGNAGDNQWSLGVTLELPIVDQNQGAIAEAEAQRKVAAAKFMALQARVCAQIDGAVAAVQEGRREWEMAKKLSAAQERQEQAAQAQYQAGAGERLDGWSARLETLSSVLAQLDSEERVQSAWASLEDALQEPADGLCPVIARLSSIFPRKM